MHIYTLCVAVVLELNLINCVVCYSYCLLLSRNPHWPVRAIWSGSGRLALSGVDCWHAYRNLNNLTLIGNKTLQSCFLKVCTKAININYKDMFMVWFMYFVCDIFMWNWLVLFPLLQSLLDMMVAEEEALKTRLMASIETCRNEMEKLCLELQLPRFEVGPTKTSHQ